MSASSLTEPKPVRNTSCFSRENLEQLTSRMTEYKLKAGERLFWEGEAADKLYYIVRGRVKLIKVSDEGRQFILHMFQDGDLFGQAVPFEEVKHDCNAEVSEPSVIGVIQKHDFESLLQEHGGLALEFMKWMGLYDRMTQAKFRDLLLFGKLGALSSMLIRLQNTYGKPHPQGILIHKKVTNSELADMIGASRENVNRMLSSLKEAEVIASEKGFLVVKNLPYLKDICRCENCPEYVCRT